MTELVVDVQPPDLTRLPTRTVEWNDTRDCDPELAKPGAKAAHSKAPHPKDNSKTVLALPIPKPPCYWPPYQYATLKVTGEVKGRGQEVLFDGTLRVSAWWFSFLVTLGVLCLIYPGCALIAWYQAEKPPGFWKALDPVQITADQYGHASLAKLQIFIFSLIIFGLLLYYQVRNGVLSGLSKDVLALLGISAVGTLGGRSAFIAKRRLKLENWAWLTSRGWLKPADGGAPPDRASRAKWRELVVDADNKELDIYNFQMAIFSLVVAVALLHSSYTGLATFEIPAELLGVLGLSHGVFILGKAAEPSAYKELDERLEALRELERKFQVAKAGEQSSDAAKKNASKVEAEEMRAAFKSEAKLVAESFWALYKEVLGDQRPDALKKVDQLEPEAP